MKVGPSTSLLVLTVPMSFVKINQCFESFDRRQEFFSFFFFFFGRESYAVQFSFFNARITKLRREKFELQSYFYFLFLKQTAEFHCHKEKRVQQRE